MTLKSLPTIYGFNPNWPTKVLDKKKPHQLYTLKNGTLVPGVTTVLGVLKKDALIHWAWNLGKQGIDYRTVRDTAADAGSVAHFMFECFVTKFNPGFLGYDNDLIEQGSKSFEKGREFWESQNYKLVKSEAQLVSETHKYGGTLDIVAVDKSGNLTLIDLKTSKAIYPDYITQVAAYSQLWNENHREQINTWMIVRIGKTDPDDFEVMEISPILLEAHFKRFLSTLSVYKDNKNTEYIQKQLVA
jgi:hypothetical protein